MNTTDTFYCHFDGTDLQKPQQSNKTALVILIVLAAALIVAAGVAAGVDVSHATMKHGSDAMVARQCLNGDHHFFLFHNLQTNRYGMVCQIDGSWGVVITDQAGHEVTAFLKDKMTRFEQVMNYMKNAGYELVH